MLKAGYSVRRGREPVHSIIWQGIVHFLGPRRTRSRTAAMAAVLWLCAASAAAVEIPPEGACPPYPVEPGSEGPPAEDVIPPAFRAGSVIDLSGVSVLKDSPHTAYELYHS